MKLQKLSPTNKAYMAGIVDGEGCICLAKQKHRPLDRVIKLIICMTNENLIRWICSTFGGRMRFRPASNPKHKHQWEWTIAGRKAVELLFELVPWIKVKEKQTTLACEWANSVTENTYPRKLGVPDFIVKNRERILLLMQEANRRGLANPRGEISLENTEVW